MGISERRDSERLGIKLSCLVCLPLRGEQYFAGTTEEISRGGMQFRFAQPDCLFAGVRPGEPVRILVVLPTSEAAPPKYLQCEGTVARVEEQGRVAFQIWRMEFRDRSEIPYVPMRPLPTGDGSPYIN